MTSSGAGGSGGGGGSNGGYIPPPPTSTFNLKLDLGALSNQLTSIFKDYKGWISRNPGRASDVESFFKILAYLLPGRIKGNSTVLPELLYSTSSVISFWHDHILRNELEQLASAQEQQRAGNERRRQNGEGPSTSASTSQNSNSLEDDNASSQAAATRKKRIFRIQVALTILEYFEVFLEVAARRLWGDAGRWIIVFVMQAIKACLRSVLVFYLKVGLTRSPAIPSFDRVKYKPNQVGAEQNMVFVLKHSGRVIRKLHASPPFYSRDWAVPSGPLPLDIERNLPTPNLLAEVIHIARPLCHLVSMGACGTSSWKPWLLSLGMDVASLYLHGEPYKQHRSDQVELQKRTMSLFLYLMRSPFYDNATKERLIGSLEGVGNRLPLIGNLLLLLSQAIPQWQGTYSYVWS